MSSRHVECLGFAVFLLAIACAEAPPVSIVMTPAGAAGAGGPQGSGSPTPGQPPTHMAPGEPGTTAPGAVSIGEDAGASSSLPVGADASPMGGADGAGSGTSVFPNNVTRPRIMIVGDSISAGPGCYKKFLLAELNANGYSSFDFVGEYPDDCGGGVMHSARSCTTALDYTQPAFTLRADCGGGTFPGLSALMAAHGPDLLLLQLGVNDVWNGQPNDAILANYSMLLEQARAQNPSIVVGVAQIQQIRPAGPEGDVVFARAQQLVDAVPAWARTVSQESSPVFVADLWTNSDAAQTLDGVHPDDAGAQRMGRNWFEALESILPPN